MSQFQQQQPPAGWGGQPQPPQQPKKNSAGKIVGFSCLGIIVALVLIGGCAALVTSGTDTSSNGSSDSSTSAPATPDEAEEEQPAAEEPKEKPEPEPEKEEPTEYGDGDYIVGDDIPAGTYESAGASSDIFDFCAITTEPSGDTMPQIKSANKGERIIITLTEADGTVTVQGCAPLTKR